MNFAVLPDPVATARGSDTPCLRPGYEKVIQITTLSSRGLTRHNRLDMICQK